MAEGLDIALATLHYWLQYAYEPSQAEATVPSLWREQIRRAAWLTTGQEPQAKWPPVIGTKLQSIFNRITPKAGSQSFTTYIVRSPLRLNEATFFPTDEKIVQSTGDNLKQALHQKLTSIQQQQLAPEEHVEHLFYALQAYAWCLPSPLEAVSLFDFARTHAAIAAVQVTEPGEVFLLGGDISGVQQFIYTLSSDGATKQLRGRSFYLQLLGEAISHMIVRRAGLPLTNILYSGGGRFYILVPRSFGQEIAALRREISAILLQRHAGELYVALGGAVYTGDQESWQRVNDAINTDKQRRFASLDADTLLRTLFSPQPPTWRSDDDSNNDLLSKSLEELGRDLHNKPYLAVRFSQRNAVAPQLVFYEPAQWFNVLRDFGLWLRPVEQSHIRSNSRYKRLLCMYDLPDAETTSLAQSVRSKAAIGTRYTVNVAPILDDDVESIVGGELERYRSGTVMPFNVMAERSNGIKRLGVLRMDVDDLGELFGRGLQRGHKLAGLAYTAALSAALSRFFEGWVGVLCRNINEKEGEQGKVYAIYSGGDDLFIVGSWHLLPQLAADIRNDFVRYTTGVKNPVTVTHPPVTLSAGITLHTAKFPLYQAADIAATALDSAKAYTRSDGRAKNALTLLGQTIGWEDYSELSATYTQLRYWIKDRDVPRGLLITIQDMYTRYQEGRKRRRTRDGRPQFEFGPWVWQGKYRLVRLADRSSDDAVKAEVKQFAEKLTTNIQTRFIERAGLAARWVQLSLRERKDEQ